MRSANFWEWYGKESRDAGNHGTASSIIGTDLQPGLDAYLTGNRMSTSG
jgi:hypothetical protein